MNTIQKVANLLDIDELEKMLKDGRHINGGRFTNQYKRQMQSIIDNRYKQVYKFSLDT